MTPLRVGVVCDYPEERWASMDLFAAMLLRSLRREHHGTVSPIEIRPAMPSRLVRAPIIGSTATARNVDRLLARLVDYPRWLKRRTEEADVYHVIDHSYAHLVHGLPSSRTVVTCHDLDTFRSVLEPLREKRGWAFRAMTGHILAGLRRAAFVTCVSNSTRDAILAHELLPPDRLAVVYPGVDDVMSPNPDPTADASAVAILGPERDGPLDLLHVGSTIARKRIDVVLRTFAAVRAHFPQARLVRVGGPFSEVQTDLLRELRIDPASVVISPWVSRTRLAAIYRRAAILLQPSDAEGFGLPVVEAMACGTPVVASDLPVLREVGGPAAEYCAVGDVGQWSATVCDLLREGLADPRNWSLRRAAALNQAALFSWSRFGDQMVDVYQRVASN